VLVGATAATYIIGGKGAKLAKLPAVEHTVEIIHPASLLGNRNGEVQKAFAAKKAVLALEALKEKLDELATVVRDC
jgi:hypothetical protein